MTARPRQRRLAVLVLCGAAVLAIVAFPLRATWWGGWILAIAEAGIVGGLADWFAVTAIFRRPLGLPIPHTALIPANWELMAERVGTMVGDRVLTKDYVSGEIARVDVSDLIARTADRITRRDLEAATAFLARWLADALRPGTGAELLSRLRRVLAEYPVAPLAASALETAHELGWDQRALGTVARALVEAFDDPGFRKTVADLIDDLLVRYRDRMAGYPRFFLGLADLFGVIDRERIVSALAAGLREVADDPAHPLRARLVDALGELPERLRTEPELAARVEATKAELLRSAVVGRLLENVAAELRQVVVADLGDPRSEVMLWIVDRLDRARRTLVADAELRGEVDRWLKAQVTVWVERYHARIATFIENGVRALGPEGAVRLVEEHAGDDLQYIRVNGTVVGGLAGGALYAVHLLLRLL